MHELVELAHNQTLLRAAHESLASGEPPPEFIRKVIRRSWARSAAAAVLPDAGVTGPIDVDVSDSRLRSVAAPVLERYSASLADTNVAILLGDRHSRLIGRWAGERSVLRRLDTVSIYSGLDLSEDVRGTNGIGTVVEELSPVAVVGAEHYAAALAEHVCVGVPIRHPLSRRFEGVLAFSCTVGETSGLLLPTVTELVERIEGEFSARAAVSERLVFESFIARCRRTSRPVVAVTDRYMLTNAPAAEWIDVSEPAILWDQLAQSFTQAKTVDQTLIVTDGTELLARCTPVQYGHKVVGAIVEFDAAADVRSQAKKTGARRISLGSSQPRADTTPVPAPASSEFAVITGPPGSGRRHIAHAMLQAQLSGAAVHRHPAPLVQSRGPRRWLSELDHLLAADGATVIVSDVDTLDELTAQGLIAVLEQHAEPGRSAPRVVLTSRPCDRADSIGRQLSATSIKVPPLADRREEIPRLCREILDAAGLSLGIGNRAMSALMNHPWRGEVAELKAVLLRAAGSAAGQTISLGDFKENVGSAIATPGARQLTNLEHAERQVIASTLDRCGGNKLRAAATLGISRSTLYKKLREYHLEDRRQLI
ncbi:MAG TPA: helix-turn-helix domain-containing protein [Streptosporangiaceae bacterium]|nr:helix-turn-helix domain-containing protein [Streptosporangiaceae bacterium]